MSNTSLAKFEQASVPAHIAKMFGGSTNTDLSGGVGGGFPYLSIKGKVWTIVRGKEREVVTNADGDPRASLKVVLIKANPNLSKTFYSTGFVEGSDAKPDCYSNDGVAPAPDAEKPQAKKCQACPHNQWGSKISDDGKKLKSCADVRRIAVAPAGQINDPMLVRVPAASLRNLAEYGGMLEKRNVPYQAVITKLAFDPEAASPKLTFAFDGWLDAEQAAQVAETLNSDVVKQIIGTGSIPGEFADNAEAASAEDEDDEAPAPKPVEKPKAAPKTRAKAAPKVDEDEVTEAVAPAPKARAKASFGDDDDVTDVEAKPVEKPKAAPKAKAAVVEDDDDLSAQLDAVLGGEDD